MNYITLQKQINLKLFDNKKYLYLNQKKINNIFYNFEILEKKCKRQNVKLYERIYNLDYKLVNLDRISNNSKYKKKCLKNLGKYLLKNIFYIG